MIRSLALLALLTALAACSHETPSTATAPPPSTPAETPVAAAPAAPPASTQSESEQASASQESSGGDGEQKEKSDASLEKIAAAPQGAQLPPGKWQAGVNYDPLVPAQPTSVGSGKVEVLEIFWLACPHCYALEPYLRSWLKSKPGYVEFVRVPVYWQPIHRAHARLFYTLDSLGRQDLVEKAMDTIHEDIQNHTPPLFSDVSDDQSFRLQEQFATQNGISADDFTKAYNSFTVNSELSRADEITQRYRVEGVPLIVVNGKYSTDVAKAGSEAKLIELINDLAASEHGH
jgi:protein dithiol oxidoreductase (disulfide-forming)